MILLITAITPEANAILSAFPMKKKDFPFPLYESVDGTLRLLVTGTSNRRGSIWKRHSSCTRDGWKSPAARHWSWADSFCSTM